MTATLLTAPQVAEKLNTDAKNCRKFLRSVTPTEDRPGKGGTWAIPAANMRTLRSQYTKWSKAQDEARAARAAAKAEVAEDTEDASEA